MFVDASVIVAILAREPGHEEIEKRMTSAGGQFFVSPLAKFEAAIALALLKGRGRAANAKPTPAHLRQAQAAVDAFAGGLEAEEIGISPEIGRLAFEASLTYGKAVGHVADLNFGDCFAYACAKALGVPLLYKGNDFAHTDLA